MALSLLAALPWNTNAQSTHDTTWLDTITVVGTRTETSIQNNPASVSVIDQEEIARRAPESIAEMLRDVPGVEVVDSSAAGMKRIRIRGESSRRVTILVDGQEITDHSTYGTPLLVDPSGVERIEVVRGPASVLYGAKAIGGVVNIITKRGAAQPIQLELGGSYYSGTRGTQGWAAVSGTLDDFDYRISGETDHHEDRKVPVGRYTSTGRLDGSSYHNDNLALHLGYAFGENRNHYLSLKADRHELSTDSWTDPDTLTYPITDFRIELPKRERRKVGLFYDGSDLGSVVRKVHADMYYQVIDRLFSNHVTMQPMPVVKVGVTSTSDDQNTNYGGTAQVDLQFHPDHYTIAGIHYLMDDLDTHKTSTTVSQVFGRPTTTITHNQDRASIRTTSAFLQDEWTLTPDVKLTAGLRYYNVQTKLKSTSSPERAGYGAETTSRTVKSLGLTYTGLPSTTLRALYSEGYIMPTLLQLFTDTTAGRGAVTLGNPGLKPETSRNIEIGTRYNADGLMLDGAVFFARAKNYITSNVSCSAAGAGCPDRATVSDYIYKNMDKADTRGLELAAEYQLPGTSFTPYLSGTWIKRELHEPSLNTYNSGTPTLSGRLGVRYEGRLVGKDVWGDVFVRAATDQKLTTGTDAAPDTTRLPGWGTLNVAFGGSLGQNDSLRYGVHFNNVLDKEYRASLDELPGTGRSVELTMRLTF